jgi:surface polysaccharide O-acyltransferase-like enzyme
LYNNIVKENRKEDLDILRVIAIIFVLSVHGLSYIGFYEHRFSGGVMFILSVVRTLFITCVPLFLIITGALHNEDNYNKKFFVRLIKIIIIYTIAAILCSIFNIVKDKITVKTILINYFSFKAAPYGWYVGMYMGLYLMIPFLNKAWNGFEEK